MGNFELKCVKICSGLNFSFEAQHSVHLVSQQKLFSPGRMSHDVIVTGFFFFFTRLGQHQTLSAQRRSTSEPEGRRLAVRGREISTKKHFMTKK